MTHAQNARSASAPIHSGGRYERHTWQAATFLVAFLAAAAAVGQNNPMVLKADIPFPFVAGNQALPAGHYELSNLGESTIRIVNSHKQGSEH
jgi:hypothetical protein